MQTTAKPLLLVALIFTGGCVPFRQSGYHDDKVSLTGTGYFKGLPSHNVHEKLTWRFFGKPYLDVRGSAPFYLEVPAQNMILFVTGVDGHAVVHLLDNSTHQERSFPARDSHIGKFIGRAQSPSFHERIEESTSDRLTIGGGNGRIEARYFIDLKTPEFLREEGEIIDQGTSSTQHYVYAGGIMPAPTR
jgi:hypothetical protein